MNSATVDCIHWIPDSTSEYLWYKVISYILCKLPLDHNICGVMEKVKKGFLSQEDLGWDFPLGFECYYCRNFTVPWQETIHSNPAQLSIEKKRPSSRLDGVQEPTVLRTYDVIQKPIPELRRNTSTYSQPTMVYRKLFRTYDGMQEKR
jgi:hypothetical protein